jgi:hypothetical protein
VALDDFIVTSYCLVDDLFEEVLDGRRLRSRALAPLLDVREVLTVEPVGESLGIDTEKGIFLFFRRRYSEWSPKLIRVHCTTFTRQAANLWKMKWLMWKALLAKTEHDGAISLVDSFAVPVCSFAKAPRHRSFAGAASCGFDAMTRAVFYGFDGHLRVAWSGVIAEATLAPPSEHDRWVAEYDPLPMDLPLQHDLGGLKQGALVVSGARRERTSHRVQYSRGYSLGREDQGGPHQDSVQRSRRRRGLSQRRNVKTFLL